MFSQNSDLSRVISHNCDNMTGGQLEDELNACMYVNTLVTSTPELINCSELGLVYLPIEIFDSSNTLKVYSAFEWNQKIHTMRSTMSK